MPAGFTSAVKVMACPTKAETLLEASVIVVAVCAPEPASNMLCETTPEPPKTTEPLADPVATGRKATFCVQLAPAARVIGTALQEPPGAVVKAPVKLIVATVIGAEPVFASVTLCGVLRMPTPSLV